MDFRSDSRNNIDSNLSKEVSTEGAIISHAVEKFFGHKNRPTGTYYTVQWYGYSPQDDTVEPPSSIFFRTSGRQTAEDYEWVTRNLIIQGRSEEQLRNGLLLKRTQAK